MEAWTKPILARLSGSVEAQFAGETAAIRQLWEAYNALLANRPTLEATVMTPGQLAVLTLAAHMHGHASDMTRQIMAAFGLTWGWPPELHESERRFESQRVLVSARPVPVQQPVPQPVQPAQPPAPAPVAASAPTPPPATEPPPVPGTLAAMYPEDFGPGGRRETRPTPSGFVEVPQVPPESPSPQPPAPATPPAQKPPDGRGERGRAVDKAMLTVVNEGP